MAEICPKCNIPTHKDVCFQCGMAIYETDKAKVIITANNYDPARREELSRKFMAPFIDRVIRELMIEKGLMPK